MTTITMMKYTTTAASLFFAAALFASAPRTFDGSWQMDTAKSHVNDSRVVSMTIATNDDTIKITMVTKKSDGQEITSEFTSKLNGKSCEASEGTHKSQITMWYNGDTLNACKEDGPVGDVTSVWKFELGPDKQTMTMKINHYEPAADDETLVFTKKGS
jgi:hypothetical protein